MGEQIAAACVRRNEAEAFGIVEPFYGAGLSSHLIILLNAWARRPKRTFDQGECNEGNQTGPAEGRTGEKGQQ
jgi:hypothetical protein